MGGQKVINLSCYNETDFFSRANSAGDSNPTFDYVLLHYENCNSVILIFPSTDFQFSVLCAN